MEVLRRQLCLRREEQDVRHGRVAGVVELEKAYGSFFLRGALARDAAPQHELAGLRGLRGARRPLEVLQAALHRGVELARQLQRDARQPQPGVVCLRNGPQQMQHARRVGRDLDQDVDRGHVPAPQRASIESRHPHVVVPPVLGHFNQRHAQGLGLVADALDEEVVLGQGVVHDGDLGVQEVLHVRQGRLDAQLCAAVGAVLGVVRAGVVPDGRALVPVDAVDVEQMVQRQVLAAHERHMDPVAVPRGHVAHQRQQRGRALEARHGKQHVAVDPAVAVRVRGAAQRLGQPVELEQPVKGVWRLLSPGRRAHARRRPSRLLEVPRVRGAVVLRVLGRRVWQLEGAEASLVRALVPVGAGQVVHGDGEQGQGQHRDQQGALASPSRGVGPGEGPVGPSCGLVVVVVVFLAQLLVGRQHRLAQHAAPDHAFLQPPAVRAGRYHARGISGLSGWGDGVGEGGTRARELRTRSSEGFGGEEGLVVVSGLMAAVRCCVLFFRCRGRKETGVTGPGTSQQTASKRTC